MVRYLDYTIGSIQEDTYNTTSELQSNIQYMPNHHARGTTTYK